MTSLTYPLAGGTLTYAFDPMGRPKELTQQITNDGQTWTRYHAKDELYGVAGEMTEMKYLSGMGDNVINWDSHVTETRQYNVRGQMTHLTTTGLRGRWSTATRRATTTGGL